MWRRGGFTLLEIVVTLVVATILALGTFKALEALYLKAARARAVTDLSLESQVVLNQLAEYLYRRVPNTAIGYDGNGSCEALWQTTQSYTVLEWLAFDEENLTQRGYDEFVDMARSGRPVLSTPDLNRSLMDDPTDYAVIFAGSFDQGEEQAVACEGAYGWHGNDHNYTYGVQAFNDDNISLANPPATIYEKYYLTKGAYAVTRAAEVDTGAVCLSDLNASTGGALTRNALLLFSGYHPYAGGTFCADKGSSGTREGKVSLLAQDVAGFTADIYNGSLRLRLDMNRSIRGSRSGVHITKQKAVF